MQKQRLGIILGVFLSVLIITMFPSNAFADVISLNTQKLSYDKGEQILFYGMETEGHENISVVIRDLSGEFITLRSTTSNSQGYYQTLPVDSDEIFSQNGIYEATAFSNDQHEVKGKTITLRYSDSNFSHNSDINKISVSTDRASYVKGETIHIFGQSPVSQTGMPVSIVIKDFSGRVVDSVAVFAQSDGKFSYFVSSVAPQWHFSGVYKINVQQVNYSSSTMFEFRGLNPTSVSISSDKIKPLVLVPDTINIKTSGSDFARVSYSVTAIDNQDGILNPKCSHPQSSIFPVGQTRITCVATDSSGNSSSESFIVNVTQKNIVIPTWVRNVAGYWCSNVMDDHNYSDALQYLIKNDVLNIPQTQIIQISTTQPIPTWVKDTTCWWSERTISDNEFVSGMEYLISKGIVKV